MLLGNKQQQAYSKVKVEANASVSSSFELISMLHERLLQEVDSLGFFIKSNDIEKKAKSAQKCIDILLALDSALDINSQQPLIMNIHRLYEHCIAVVFAASKDMDGSKLAHVKAVLEDLKEGWEGAAEIITHDY